MTKKRKNSRSKRGMTILMVILTLLFAGLSCATFISPYVSPLKTVIFHYLGLVSPFILAGDLILLIYWIIKKRIWLVVPLISIVLNIGYISSMVRVGISENDKESALRVATYNIDNFGEGKNLNPIVRFISSQDIDIIALQEAWDFSLDILKKNFSEYNYINKKGELVIMSKYPILDVNSQQLPNQTGYIFSAKIDYKGENILFATTHLQTTGISSIPRRVKSSGYLSFKGEQYRFSKNARVRAKQANAIAKFIDNQELPIIICGDFNDTPASYTYRKVKGKLVDGFKDCGSAYASTFFEFFGIFRIDYIFYDHSFRGLKHSISDVKLSDHKAVIMDVELRE